MAAMDLMALMAVIALMVEVSWLMALIDAMALMAGMISLTLHSEIDKGYKLFLIPEMLDTTAAMPTSASIPSWLSKHPK